MTERFGQLGYTSLDAGAGPGGWQVKETNGQITAEESRLLVTGIHTTINPVAPLPRYPTPDQIGALPHRLAYRRVGERVSAYWHTAPAGFDDSGRPGNAFVHAVLDRDAFRAEDLLRPIERWGSRGWLTPYGAEAIRAAHLPGEPPPPGCLVGAGTVVDFICDTETWRLNTLCGLLDAVAAALGGGPTVVLGVDSIQSAALWIGAVSFLTSAGTAGRLGFSTFERGYDLQHALRDLLHLVVVPRCDLPGVSERVLVIDEAEELSVGELHRQPHHTARGQPIAVTPWSAMAQVVLVDPLSAAQVIVDIDELTRRIGGADLPAALPMALAVLNRESWADVAPEARLVISVGPPRLRADPVITDTVETAVRDSAGVTTADAWRAVASSKGLFADIANSMYICRALRDPEWLASHGRNPVPARPFAPGTIPGSLAAEAPSTLSTIGRANSEMLLRATDLLVSSGCGDLVREVVEQQVVPLLLDETAGGQTIDRLGTAVGRPTRALLAAAVLDSVERPGGAEPCQQLLEWLADGVPTPSAQQVAQAQPGDPVWTAAALRGAIALTSGASRSRDRFPALWWLYHRGAGGSVAEVRFDPVPWDPAELLIAVGDGRPPVGPAIATLVGVPDSAALHSLAERVMAAEIGDRAVACAALRLLEPAQWLATGYLRTHGEEYVQHWNDVLAAPDLPRAHRDFSRRLIVLTLLAAVADVPPLDVSVGLISDAELGAEAVDRMDALVDSGAVDANELIAATLLCRSGDEADVCSLLRSAAARSSTAENVDADTIMERITALARGASDGTLRQYRRSVHRLLADRAAGGRHISPWGG